jgi:hypothetical protein
MLIILVNYYITPTRSRLLGSMKKLNVVLSFTFASLISISPPAFAKGVDGGGGGAYICPDPTQSEFLDLYEARRDGFVILSKSTPVDEQIQDILSRLNPCGPALRLAMIYELGRVQTASVRSRPSDQDIAWPSDEENKYGKKGCAGKGLIVFYDDTNSKDEDQQSLESMPNTEQAAAWVHEAVYKYLRDTQGDTDATRARKVVKQLFSEQSDSDRKSAISDLNIEKLPGSPYQLDMTNPALGISYRDAQGLIWGSLEWDFTKGQALETTEAQAETICQSKGARLSTLQEIETHPTTLAAGWTQTLAYQYHGFVSGDGWTDKKPKKKATVGAYFWGGYERFPVNAYPLCQSALSADPKMYQDCMDNQRGQFETAPDFGPDLITALHEVRCVMNSK